MDCYKHNKPMTKVREWREDGTRWRQWSCALCSEPMNTALERVLFEPPKKPEEDGA